MKEKHFFSAVDDSDQKNKEMYAQAKQNAEIVFVLLFIFTKNSKVRYAHTQIHEKQLFSVQVHFLEK